MKAKITKRVKKGSGKIYLELSREQFWTMYGLVSLAVEHENNILDDFDAESDSDIEVEPKRKILSKAGALLNKLNIALQ